MSETPETLDVLLADDDPDELLVFELALRNLSFPFRLRQVHDGEELMRELNRQVPAILFLDIRMPCKDGLACIEEIRTDNRFNHMPVVMYSTMRTPMNLAKTCESGAQYFLEKTGSVAELSDKLRLLFSRDLTAVPNEDAGTFLV